MKLSVKTISQQQYVVDVEPTDTIAQVKTKIEVQEKQPAAWQKLIYAGKVLEDNTTIAAANMKENDFLVLMVRKPKEEPTKVAPPATTGTASPAPTPVKQDQPKPAENKPVEQPKPADKPADKPAESTSTGSTNTGIAMGAEYERAITQLMEMGFEKEQVVKAMRAAFNNPDRAAEYLFSGIPNMPAESQPSPSQQRQQTSAPQTPTPQQPAQQPVQQQPQQPQQPSSPQSSPFLNPNTPLIPPQFMGQQQQQSAQSGSGVFDFLRQHPHFNSLRMMVQQQPELLQPVLQQLGQTNPAILQLIQQHQQEFIQLLNEPVQSTGQTGTGQTGTGMPGMPGMPPTGGPQYIQVSQEEKAAIDRLEKMGFDRSLVIEAFFACDKDEQLAANYLLEHMGEEMLDQDEQNQ